MIRGNVDALGSGGATKVYRRDATRLGDAGPNGAFALAFLDPPYGQGLAERALASARDGGWLTANALAVVEEAADATFIAPTGFEELERRDYGDTQLAVPAAQSTLMPAALITVPQRSMSVLRYCAR